LIIDGRTEVLTNFNGTWTTYNLYGLDAIGQIRRSGSTWTRFYFLKDHLGSVKVIVDASGNRIAHTDMYPFGYEMPGRVQGSSSVDGRYKFTGKERDVETKYDYFGARYYDARIGRWLQVDPMAEKYPGWSPYSYCLNNPIIFVDSKGKDVGKALSHYINAIAYGAEFVTGLAMVLGAIGIGRFGLVKKSIPIGFAGAGIGLHGGYGFVAEVRNASIELVTSLADKYGIQYEGDTVLSKWPSGLFEFISVITNQSQDSTELAIKADILLNLLVTLDKTYGIQLASHASLGRIELTTTTLKSLYDLTPDERIKKILELLRQYVKIIELEPQNTKEEVNDEREREDDDEER